MATRNHFLARIAAFLEVDAVNQIQVQGLGNEQILCVGADPGQAGQNIRCFPTTIRGLRSRVWLGRNSPVAIQAIQIARGLDQGVATIVLQIPDSLGAGLIRHTVNLQLGQADRDFAAQHEHAQALDQGFA